MYTELANYEGEGAILQTDKCTQHFRHQLQGVITVQLNVREKTALISGINYKFAGVSKTTPSFDNSLKELAELTTNYHTHSYGLLYGKDSERKRLIGRNLGSSTGVNMC